MKILHLLFSVIALACASVAWAELLPYGPGITQKADFISGSTTLSGGHVVSGYLSTFNQTLWYSSSKQVDLAGGSTVSFSGGYVSLGLTTSSSTVDLKQLLYYGSTVSQRFYVKPGSVVRFQGGYLTEGTPAYDQTIIYGGFNGTTTAFMSSGAFVKLANGYLIEGYLSTQQSFHTLGYGPARDVYLKGGSYAYFGGTNTVSGKFYVRKGLTYNFAQSLRINATQLVSVNAYTTVNFANGFYTP